MAEDKTETQSEQAQAGTYKFMGSKRPWETTSSVRLLNGEVAYKGGEPIEIDDDELESLKAAGYRFTKAEKAEPDQASTADQPSNAAEQQQAQVASGAQHPASNPDKDNTPQGRASRGGAS